MFGCYEAKLINSNSQRERERKKKEVELMTQSKCVMSSFCPVALFRDTPIRNICI